MKTEINNQKNKENNLIMKYLGYGIEEYDIIEECWVTLKPPESMTEYEQETLAKINSILNKYNISEERLLDVAKIWMETVHYEDYLRNHKSDSFYEKHLQKKWGYDIDSFLYGYIVNMYKSNDDKNEIVIEVMYDLLKIALLKVNLNKPKLHEIFSKRFRNIYVLSERVNETIVCIKLNNKTTSNGTTFSMVEDITLFTKEEMETMEHLFVGYDYDDYALYWRMKDAIHQANEKEKRIQRIKETKKRKA